MMRSFLSGLLAMMLIAAASSASWAQTGFDRPGGDYHHFAVPTGDPEICAARCDRENRCRAWSFSYPGNSSGSPATCWLKSRVTPPKENGCCTSGVKGAALRETRVGAEENSIDRVGGDYRNFEIPQGQDFKTCAKACSDDNRCRAWSYSRPGYGAAQARCFLKDKVTAPRRRPCCVSGVVR